MLNCLSHSSRCIYMHLHAYTCIYMHIHVHIHVHVHVHAHVAIEKVPLSPIIMCCLTDFVMIMKMLNIIIIIIPSKIRLLKKVKNKLSPASNQDFDYLYLQIDGCNCPKQKQIVKNQFSFQ